MNKFLVTCTYDGTDFVGWQVQKSKRSVQSEIEKAIACFDKDKHIIVGCSRTDAKVHALGQCFHWETNLNIKSKQVIDAINAHLPDDIRIINAEKVNQDFHARYHAKKKCYKYIINNGEYNIFERNHQVFIKEKLNIEKMQVAAEIFIGIHDFTTFCATTLKEKNNQSREITALTIKQIKDIIEIEFEGIGFLRYMVRMISQTLIEVGKGKLSNEEVEEMLNACDKSACRYNAKPEGLYLVRIDYEKN